MTPRFESVDKATKGAMMDVKLACFRGLAEDLEKELIELKVGLVALQEKLSNKQGTLVAIVGGDKLELPCDCELQFIDENAVWQIVDSNDECLASIPEDQLAYVVYGKQKQEDNG
jgi:hypothetical protein